MPNFPQDDSLKDLVFNEKEIFFAIKCFSYFMPYYRIIIWVKQQQALKAIQGIWLIDSIDIEIVYRQMWKNVIHHYGEYWVHDVEVQMLPKFCSAVKTHLELIQKKSKPSLLTLNSNRKERKGEALMDK